jgi:NAD(P)-dependent dehydrogenase (short-subunit alcohol dehydrogenase family)
MTDLTSTATPTTGHEPSRRPSGAPHSPRIAPGSRGSEAGAAPGTLGAALRQSDRLAGKNAIVVGGGSRGRGVGNGEAIAMLLAMNGASVVVADVDERAGLATVESITSGGGRAIAVAADATKLADCQALVNRAHERFGTVDVLVNNQGATGPSSSVVDVSETDWDHTFAVNVSSIMLVCKCVLPAISDDGSIINMSSIGALRWTERTAYAASKGAVLSLTVALAGQCAPRGVRVNALVPGAIWTPLVMEEAAARVGGDSAAVERIRAQRQTQALLPSEGTAWDTAWAALFLASDESRWITGQAIVIDGGASIARRLDHANA